MSADLESLPVFVGAFLVALLAAKQLQQIVLGLLDPELQPAAQSKRTAAAEGHAGSLTVGRLPHADAAVSVAYLRDGVRGLAELVRERAFAEGWLRNGETSGHVAIGSPRQPSDKLTAALRAALPAFAATQSEVEAASLRVAAAASPVFSTQLSAVGLLRTRAQLASGVIAYAAVALALLAWAGARLSSGEPLSLAAFALLACAALAFAALGRPRPQTDAGVAYLAWLRGATTALREDLEARRLQTRADLMLLIASHGMSEIVGKRSPGEAPPPATTYLHPNHDEAEGGGGSA